jgi:hypothetical protein
MEKSNNFYIENDKTNAPFLLAASFNGLIKFVGTRIQGTVLYWQFFPKEKAQELIDQFQMKTEPHVPARDLFEATQTFWKKIQELRDGENRNKEI